MISRLPLVAALIGVVGAFVLTSQATADTPGDGQTHVDRLPWLDGGSRELDQGWFGHYSHYSQYGEDWRLNGNAFAVHAATEGDATCYNWNPQGGDPSGEYVALVRTTSGATGGWTDHYFHLNEATCSSGGWTQHFEQGDFLANASNTGTGGIHLHYEPRNGSGPTNSVYHCESGLCNMYFCDHDDTAGNPPPPDSHDGELGFQCSQGFNGAWYISDNAGPGQGAGNAYIGAGMALMYRNIGHWYCGANQAWDCNGSSNAFFSGTEKASPSYQGGDWAWHQQFRNPGGLWGNLSAPNACGGGVSYWVPNNNFLAWLPVASTFGHPRSGYYYNGSLWVQYFRYGVIISYSFGGTAYALGGGPYDCQ